jgi:hypothetical protein
MAKAVVRFLAGIMLVAVAAAAASAERVGTSITGRTIVDGAPPNEAAVLSALVAPGSRQYVTALRYWGVDVQLSTPALPLQGFPTEGATFVVLSTGSAGNLAGNAAEFSSEEVGGVSIPGGSPGGLDAYDVARLTVTLDLRGVDKLSSPELSFVFAFGSEEVPDFVGTVFQDYFTAYAYDEAGQFIGNVARLPSGEPFTIDNAWPLMNHVGCTCMSPCPPFPTPDDTTMNGFTDRRPVRLDLSSLAGQICTLVFELGDAGDARFDSAVLLDSLTISGGGSPSEEIDLGLVVVRGDSIVALDISNRRFRVQGNVQIGDQLRCDGVLEVDTSAKVITGNCRLWFAEDTSGSKLKMPDFSISDLAIAFSIDASKQPILVRFYGKTQELAVRAAGVTVLAKELEIFFNDATYGYGLKANVYLSVQNVKSAQPDAGPKGELYVNGFFASSILGIGFTHAKVEITKAMLGQIKLTKLILEYDVPSDRFDAHAEVWFPAWQSDITGDLAVIGGALDTLAFDWEHYTGIPIIGLPVPPSALYLQSLEGGVHGLTTDAPWLNAGFGMTYGPEYTFGGKSLHLLRFDVAGIVRAGYFELSGTVDVMWEGGTVGSASVKWWVNDKVVLEGSLDLGGILKGSLYATINDHFRCISTLDAQIPDGVPLIGGRDFGSIKVGWEDWTIGFVVGADVWPFGWCEVSVLVTANPDCPYAQGCWFGFPVPFTPVSIYAGCNLDELLSKSFDPEVLNYLAQTRGVVSEVFLIVGSEPFLIARVQGDAETEPYFEVVSPTGQVITPAIASSNPASYYYSSNPTIGEAWMAVRNPAGGQWQILIPETSASVAKNGLTVQALGALEAPEIGMTSPSAPVTTDGAIVLAWSGEDPAPTAEVRLFYTAVYEEAGAMIAEGLPLSGSHEWQVHGTAPGTYWVYAEITDGRNAAQRAFAPGKVTITKAGPSADLVGTISAEVGQETPFDATGSSDPWDCALSYEWQLESYPSGSSACIVPDGTGEHARLTPDLPGEYVLALMVCDPFGASSTAKLTLTAWADPASLHVPQVGTITFVGQAFRLTGTVTDGADNPYGGAVVHFEVLSGPHQGTATAATSDALGQATMDYVGSGEGIDRIAVWVGDGAYAQTPAELKAEIGHVWFREGCSSNTHELLTAGWHMVSLPGALCDPCTWMSGECGDLVCALGDDVDPFVAYRYDAAPGAYAQVPPADGICYLPGMSVWLYTYEADTEIDAEMTAPTGSVAVPLRNGWNQIGNPYTFAMGAGSILVQCGVQELSLIDAQTQGWISATLYGYDTNAGAYVELDPATGCIPAWTGCWIRTYRADCTLVFQPVGCTSSLTQARLLSAAEARALELPPPPPLVPQALDIEEVLAGLSATNIPNPIRSEFTTVFRVEGARADAVDAMRVDIYGQDGQRVFTQEIAAKELAWHTANDAGELLANGVYLYRVWVKIDEVWYPLEIQKLAVVR